VNCDFARRHLIEDERVPASRIQLCYNGVDTARFHPAPGLRPEPLRDASLVVGVVCGLRPEKDVATLVEAFARVRGMQPGLKLAVVGSGACLPDLQARARDLGIFGDCIFEPATAGIAAWLHGIDIFVLPSRTEALSNALMEAMASGCCALASRVGGNPELVADGETGLLFEPGDAAGLAALLSRLIARPQERQALACNAAALMRQKFPLEAAARRMAEIYSSYLA
jgi:glycosyltransferase involved in cell wall biosynthesis